MDVLIGIPTHKRPALLRKCLESIRAQEGLQANVRVFVADNDPDGRQGVQTAADMAPNFPYPLASAIVPEPGISAVRNAILDETKRDRVDYVAMIDDDEVASSNWLSELLKVQAAFDADVVGGPVKFEFDVGTPEALKLAFWTDPRPAGVTDIIDGTGNVLVSVSALKRLGWPRFDAEFGLTGGGDKEWFTRLKHSGARFAWAAEAPTRETVPPDRATVRWYLKRGFRIGVDDIRIARMHEPRSTLANLSFNAMGVLGTAPLFCILLMFPRRRIPVLGRWARSTGRLSSLLGFQYREYAVRHGQLLAS